MGNMKQEDVEKMLRPAHTISDALYRRFGEACRDPEATIMAVHDFESFSRAANKWSRRRRKDKLERLYGLYLAISKTRLALSVELLKRFKDTLPDYQNVSMFYFLEDLKELSDIGVIIVRAPLIEALTDTAHLIRQHKALLAAANRPDEDVADLEEMFLNYRIPRNPPRVWPDI